MIFQYSNDKNELTGTLIKDRERYEVGNICKVLVRKDSGNPEFVVINNIKQLLNPEKTYVIPVKFIEFNKVISNYKVAQISFLKSEISNAPVMTLNSSTEIDEDKLEKISQYFESCSSAVKEKGNFKTENLFFSRIANKKLSF